MENSIIMKAKAGMIVTEMSGSLGGHTFQNSKGGFQIRTKPIPTGKPSASQTLIRSYNPVLQAGWKALTPSQQQIWNDWPVTHGIFNAKGEKHPLSGHSLWMKYQYQRIAEELPFLSNPSLHLISYLGPELIEPLNFNNWSDLGGSVVDTFTSFHIASLGGRLLFCLNEPGYYQVKYNCISTAGFMRAADNDPLRYFLFDFSPGYHLINFPRINVGPSWFYVRNSTAIYGSISFSSISLKHISNY
jgi:hypothetical protein